MLRSRLKTCLRGATGDEDAVIPLWAVGRNRNVSSIPGKPPSLRFLQEVYGLFADDEELPVDQ